MGKVFLALDQKTGKEVAVKIVKDQKQWDLHKQQQPLRHILFGYAAGAAAV